MTIEEDIERVQQVTDKLAGPQQVWILTNHERHGETYTWVFATEAIARAHWIRTVEQEFQAHGSPNAEWQAEVIEEISAGGGSCHTVSEDDWYSLDAEIVVTEPPA